LVLLAAHCWPNSSLPLFSHWAENWTGMRAAGYAPPFKWHLFEWAKAEQYRCLGISKLALHNQLLRHQRRL
jgi:hypothetical protein